MGIDKFLNITYKLVSKDNFGTFLEAMGVSDQVREVILTQNPTLVLSKNGGKYCCKTSSPVREIELNFTPGEEFDHVGIDGRTYRGVIKIDGNKTINSILSPTKSTIVSEFSDDKVVIHFEVNGIEATHIYEKM